MVTVEQYHRYKVLHLMDQNFPTWDWDSELEGSCILQQVDQLLVRKRKDFADFCFKTYGDRVMQWTTFNEPRVVTALGYDNGNSALRGDAPKHMETLLQAILELQLKDTVKSTSTNKRDESKFSWISYGTSLLLDQKLIDMLAATASHRFGD
ncbi:hypothetical protein V6N13_093111 [Hibiscus sabdariffa]